MILKAVKFFWETTKYFLDVKLKSIRNLSDNTIDAYRNSINAYILYLEEVMSIPRTNITFSHFTKDYINPYLIWMRLEKKLAPRTCNLRITAIRSLLKYAAEEDINIMPIYVSVTSIDRVKIPLQSLEYFEADELSALLRAPPTNTKTGRRNRMILSFAYDTAARVCELQSLTLADLHLYNKTPYVTLLGKGGKYRNIPLTDRLVKALNTYVLEFHPVPQDKARPLFYTWYGSRFHSISSDTFEQMIKKYANECIKSGQTMPKKVHCHMLRKTRAMDLYNEGVPLPHIQQLLGHEESETTTGFYAFATLDKIRESIEKVNPESDIQPPVWKNPDVLDALFRL